MNPGIARLIQGILASALAGAGGGGSSGSSEGGSAPPSPDHRYWRTSNFTGTSASYWETTEVQLLDGVSVLTGGMTPTASVAPDSGGGLDALTDSALGSPSRYWTTANANTLALTWDFGTPVFVDGIKISRHDTAGRFPTNVDLEWSDNGTDWTAAGSASPIEPGSNSTLSATATFA